ncbi:uncharacterized protein LOC102081016 [Oreochromis niloticus]|uniref:uncharacterized protein LOC102081016 n=1 Tax=Oreochromis niloticus TaxID=8128 RepID=UPI000DF4A6A5|nr:uncharacterized protein LOC102081016 [Oreochromis niloticus]
MKIAASSILSTQDSEKRYRSPSCQWEIHCSFKQQKGPRTLNMKMILTSMIIAALTTAPLAQGLSECNLTQPRSHKCFGILGQPLIFYLPTSLNTKTRLEKNTDVILKLANYSLLNINEKYRSRSTFFTNGTFMLRSATKNDSGGYKMEKHTPDGVLLHTIIVELDILAPVSEPAVSQTCLSPEQMTVSCFSEGDEVEFTLSLHDNSLIQTRPMKTDKHNVLNIAISLHGQMMGNLTCIVQNNVSRAQTVVRLRNCTDTISHLSALNVVVVASISILLLDLALLLGIKYFNRTTNPITVNEVHAGVVYSVRVKQHTRKTPTTSHQNAN